MYIFPSQFPSHISMVKIKVRVICVQIFPVVYVVNFGVKFLI